MTTKALDEAMKRVSTWPAEAQEELAGIALELDAAMQGGEYHASPEELAGIDRGLEAARDGRFASPERVAALLDRLDRLLGGVASVGELTARSKDAVVAFGEMLSTQLMGAAMGCASFTGQHVGIVTNDQFGKAEPLMDAYALRIVHVGAAGAGQQTKMVNQIAIAGLLQGLSEALRFAQASELDLERVFEAISGGAAQSWQMVNRWQTMAEDKFDFGFAVDWMRKDLGLAIDEAKKNGASLPVTALVDQFYADVQKNGRRAAGYEFVG